MIRLTYPALTAMAQALIAHRETSASAVEAWETHHRLHGTPHAAEIALRCRAELDGVDNALRELQAVAPPFLDDFLRQQIDLIQQTALPTKPSTQEQP